MKRLLPGIVALLAIATILLAQTPAATLRAPNGDHPIAITQKNGVTYFAADDAMAALGGSVSRDENGFRATLSNNTAAFGTESRFGVIKDDLIEMPVPPIVIDNKPYVPLQFLQGFLVRAARLDAAWDPAARVLTVRPAVAATVGVQLSVANVQGISKIVLTLTAPAEYTVVKEPGAYTVRFRTPIKPPVAEQAYDDPNVAKATFAGQDARFELRSADVVADTYRLENPFRIVLDLHKGAPMPPGVVPPVIAPRVAESAPGIRTIVIDPGHGGKEIGAIGPSGMMEKDVTLTICRKLADALSRKLGARVILTRNDDVVVSLDQRTGIANQYHADLFLSVHMNAAVVKGAHGSETYFLSADASDEVARKAAETENASAKAGEPSSSSDLKLILWDLAQQEYLTESSRFAQTVQEEMNAATGVLSRGVKQAPFKVLVGATMPAALVEVAFITNPDEESKLRNDEFQKKVVDSLTHAV
jgi:N-acetylmuramoyl-L-alanine amidase